MGELLRKGMTDRRTYLIRKLLNSPDNRKDLTKLHELTLTELEKMYANENRKQVHVH
ncbi:Fur-regulated basic protein FbpA [Alkalihalobacillus macyae]|uniref:Fur-regulated basic protein FbpA n=1 Tax=Guptibacillus hwajinpoensis TaxID=208199 RepID=UPI00273B259E|nr:Fur-regulated basic protein FbpA [Alkalihalobacillus macyae]MDP4551647.1 Fur-regulated basic protein FbpA [Alkalihalobacillus macyae]